MGGLYLIILVFQIIVSTTAEDNTTVAQSNLEIVPDYEKVAQTQDWVWTSRTGKSETIEEKGKGAFPELKTQPKDATPRFLSGLKDKLCQIGIGHNNFHNEILDDDSYRPLIRNPRKIKNEEKQKERIKNRIKQRLQNNNLNQKSTDTPSTSPTKRTTTQSTRTVKSIPATTKLDDTKLASTDTSSDPFTRLFGSGLDGLKGPAVAPSFGVHFGSLPSSYGGFSPFGGGGVRNTNPLGLDVGPVSLNPFVGFKVTKLDGRKIFTPSLDLLISPNAKGVHEIEKLKSKVKGEPNFYDAGPPIVGPPIVEPFHGQFPVAPGPLPITPPIHHGPHQQLPTFHHGPPHQLPPHLGPQHQLPPHLIETVQPPHTIHPGPFPQQRPPIHHSQFTSPVNHQRPPSFVPIVEERPVVNQNFNFPNNNDDRFHSSPVISHPNQPTVHHHKHHHEHTHIHNDQPTFSRPFSQPTFSRPASTHFQNFGRSDSRDSKPSSSIFREEFQPFRPIVDRRPSSAPIFTDSFREPRSHSSNGNSNSKKFTFPSN